MAKIKTQRGKYAEWITADGLLQIEGWARDGLIDEQIAHNIGIARQTLYDWKKRYPDIDDALKRGKAPVDIEVENALLKRAKGFEYEEVTTLLEYGKTGEPNRKVTRTKKIVPPDTTAAIFWLKNRKPEYWRDRREVDTKVSGALSVEDTATLAQKYLQEVTQDEGIDD